MTVVKPDGQAQAVLGLTNGNSTIWVQPFSAHSKGSITISHATGPNIKVGDHHTLFHMVKRQAFPFAALSCTAARTLQIGVRRG